MPEPPKSNDFGTPSLPDQIIWDPPSPINLILHSNQIIFASTIKLFLHLPNQIIPRIIPCIAAMTTAKKMQHTVIMHTHEQFKEENCTKY